MSELLYVRMLRPVYSVETPIETQPMLGWCSWLAITLNWWLVLLLLRTVLFRMPTPNVKLLWAWWVMHVAKGPLLVGRTILVALWLIC